MKRSSLLMTLFGLLHLVVIDLTFYVLMSGSPEMVLVLGIYNMVWLYIIGKIASQGLSASQEN